MIENEIAGLWKLTNGWFALCSGISACPLTAPLLKKYAGLRLSGWFAGSVLSRCSKHWVEKLGF
jgi:hypothetical protein